MGKQSSFAELEYQSKKRLTRRELFLNEMEYFLRTLSV